MSRSADDVGAGLRPARQPRPIREGERIHVVGAAGAGASAAALLAHHAGALVDGCDAGGASPYSAALEAAGIVLEWRHSADHVLAPTAGIAPDRLAVTKALTSVAPNHPELVAARDAGIALEPWQQIVADAAATAGGTLVAVAGTHGKSTTAGWLVDLLVRDGRDPAAFVGALLPAQLTGGMATTARWGGGTFVVEADEYAGNFDPYLPAVALLLNVEWDHPDVFADQAAVEDAFADWLERAAGEDRHPTLVANLDDAGVIGVCRRLADWPGELLGVTMSGPDVDGAEFSTAAGPATIIRARPTGRDAGSSRFSLERWDGRLELSVGLPGEHNTANALVLAGACAALGVSDDALRASLASFGGVGRRLELKGEARGVIVLDDYGHHPTAIARTLEAVRQRYPGRRLWAVYEPLTFHRTAQMLDRFADVLAAGADRVAIADIWAGRDRDTTVTSAGALAAAVNVRGGPPATAPGSVEQAANFLAGEVEPGDVVLIMGGGRSYVIAERLLELLRGRSMGT